MGIQPSMSRTDLLLNCQRPFADDTEIEPDESGAPARYGLAFHELLARYLGLYFKWRRPGNCTPTDREVLQACAKHGVTTSAGAGLGDHVMRSMLVLCQWLEGKNLWGFDFTAVARKDPELLRIEAAVALAPTMKVPTIRGIELPREEDHVYEDVEPGEMPGTVDLGLPGLLALDTKTGHDNFSSPADLGQLRSLGVALSAKYVAVLDTPREGIPAVYAERLTPGMKKRHVRALAKALRRINDGSMRPGPWCKTCAAREGCPTQHANLVQTAAAVMAPGRELALATVSAKLTTAEDVGKLHLLMAQFSQLEKPAKTAIREWMKANPDETPVRPDGRVMGFKTKTVTSLSQASIVRAYGKLKAARVLKKLREDGAIEESTREELWALNDR